MGPKRQDIDAVFQNIPSLRGFFFNFFEMLFPVFIITFLLSVLIYMFLQHFTGPHTMLCEEKTNEQKQPWKKYAIWGIIKRPYNPSGPFY